jgi:2-iminoacetate synthase ThiH
MKIPEEYIDDPGLKEIAAKITSGSRISMDEGLTLYTRADLSLLALLSGIERRRQKRKYVYVNKN